MIHSDTTSTTPHTASKRQLLVRARRSRPAGHRAVCVDRHGAARRARARVAAVGTAAGGRGVVVGGGGCHRSRAGSCAVMSRERMGTAAFTAFGLFFGAEVLGKRAALSPPRLVLGVRRGAGVETARV